MTVSNIFCQSWYKSVFSLVLKEQKHDVFICLIGFKSEYMRCCKSAFVSKSEKFVLIVLAKYLMNLDGFY